MSPKKQPCNLNSMCIKTLSNQLIHALSDEDGIHQHKVIKYIYSATYDTLQSLLQEILGKLKKSSVTSLKFQLPKQTQNNLINSLKSATFLYTLNQKGLFTNFSMFLSVKNFF